MDSVIRAAIAYFFLLIVLRVSGKRTLGEMTSFDLVLLLIVSEAVQQMMVDSDNSMTNAMLLVATLVGLDVALSLLKERSSWLEKLLDDVPLVLIEDGRLLKDRMEKVRVDEEDILEAARCQRGLERLEQVKYAVLERSGKIAIIPKADAGWDVAD